MTLTTPDLKQVMQTRIVARECLEEFGYVCGFCIAVLVLLLLHTRKNTLAFRLSTSAFAHKFGSDVVAQIALFACVVDFAFG